jgi:Domain of unknown function (DUF4271)
LVLNRNILLFCFTFILFCKIGIAQDSTQVANPNTTTSSTISSESFVLDTGQVVYQRRRPIKPIDSALLTTVVDSSILTTADNDLNRNPFDFKYSGAANTTIETQNTKVQQPIETPKKVELKKAFTSKKEYSQNFNFWVLLSLLIFLAIALKSGRPIIKKSYNGIVNNNSLKNLLHDVGGFGNTEYLMFNIFYWSNLALFLFQILNYKSITIHSSQFISFLICCGITFGVYILKQLIIIGLGYLYPLTKEMQNYHFIIIISGVLMGLVILPVNIIVAFTSGETKEIFIYLGVIIIVLFYLLRYIKAFTLNAKTILTYFFHFILYLCTVEIAPLLVLIRFALNKLG